MHGALLALLALAVAVEPSRATAEPSSAVRAAPVDLQEAVDCPECEEPAAFRYCPPNAYLWGHRHGKSYCISCPAGLVSSGCTSSRHRVRGIPVCVADPTRALCVKKLALCAKGQFRHPHVGDKCAACPKGKWQSRAGTALCFACPAGMYQPRDGAVSCYNCPVGQYRVAVAATKCTKCSSCPRGRFGTTATTGKKAAKDCACKQCLSGRFAPSGQTTCYHWCVMCVRCCLSVRACVRACVRNLGIVPGT